MKLRTALSLLLLVTTACDPGPQRPAPAATKAPPTDAKTPAPAKAPEPEPEPATDPNAVVYQEAAGVQYVEVVTGGAQAEDSLPLIIAIHGLGDRPEHFADLVRDLPVRARIVLPRALDPHTDRDGAPLGFSWFPIRARSKDVEALGAGIRRATDSLAGMLEALSRSRPTLGRPIVTGFSQGGMLSFSLAALYPEQVAAAFPVGGWLPPPLWPKDKAKPGIRNPPVVALHGDVDRALLIANTRESVAHQKSQGFDVTLIEYAGIGHQITPEMRDKLFTMLGEAAERERGAGTVATPTTGAQPAQPAPNGSLPKAPLGTNTQEH